MADFGITSTDAQIAAQIVREILGVEVPSGDFSPGGVLDGSLVDGHAVVVAFLRQQLLLLKNSLSVRTLKNLPDSTSISDAVDAILDNLFIARGQGTFSKGTAVLHFSQKVDVLVSLNHRFFKTSQLVFVADSASPVLIPASALRPNLDASGNVVDWVANLQLTAMRTGTAYNIDPGRFVGADQFSRFFLYAENLTKWDAGTDVQSSADLIAQVPTAMALRALINARSNQVVLKQQNQQLDAVTTVGYGDPEMPRDLVTGVSNAVALHVGGHTDIYLRLPIQQVVETLTIGGDFLRNDDLSLYFTDSATDFVAAGVTPGCVLVIDAGLPEAPVQYKIVGVQTNKLTIASHPAFSKPTDEAPAVTFAYSIGNNYPAFDNKVSVGSTLTANTSRTFSQTNRVELPGRPTYSITSVELLNPPSALNSFLDPLTGTVIFSVRRNSPQLAPPTEAGNLGYFLINETPELAQTSKAVLLLEVGWSTVDLTGLQLQVTYDTLNGFSTLDGYVLDAENRPAAANNLVRGYHPIYVSATIPYRVRATTTDLVVGTVEAIDEAAGEAQLVSFIQAYSSPEPFDIGLLDSETRNLSPSIAGVFAFTVFYDLLLPDGRVLHYSTQDFVTVFPDGTNTAKLLNPTDVSLPTTGYYAGLSKFLLSQGVSNRTVRYLALPGNIVLQQLA